MRLTELRPVFVDHVPRPCEPGILYISEKYGCSIHICPCGTCGQEVVLPFHNPDTGWLKTGDHERVTFRPSVGNWQYPCKSHYYITDNKVEWL